jgi:mRNA interferase MazF
VKTPLRGEVYVVDLGLAAKVRPCVVASVPLEHTDRALVTVVPHTTSLRQSRYEVTAASPRFLKSGAFDVQGIVTVPTVRLMNRLGTLNGDQMRALERAICLWLGITIAA